MTRQVTKRSRGSRWTNSRTRGRSRGEHAHREIEQVVGVDPEEAVARIGLEEVDERLGVVAVGGKARALEDGVELAAQQGDLACARLVCGGREETEEPPLAGQLAARVEALDPDVVEVGGPVDGGARVGLRQDEQ